MSTMITAHTMATVHNNAVHNNAVVTVYTDGACVNNGKKNASAGIGVFFADNDNRNTSESLNKALKMYSDITDFSQTNNRAELTAILHALYLCVEHENVILYTDSMYSINCLTKWYIAWQKKEWKTSTGKNVLNQDLIKKILECIKAYKKVDFKYTKAHTREPDKKSIRHVMWYGNHMADALATSAASITK